MALRPGAGITLLATLQEVKPLLAASSHRRRVRPQASAMHMGLPTGELVQMRSSQAHAHTPAWTVSKVPEPSMP